MSNLLSATCRCGTPKLPASDTNRIGYCLNCDFTHDGITPQDRRYNLAWEQLKRQFYKPASHWPDGKPFP